MTNPFDILVVIVLGYSVVRGLFRGLVKEAASVIGVLVGFYLAYRYYGLLDPYLRFIGDEAYRHIAGFLIIFIGVLVAVAGLAIVIRYLLKVAFLGWADRTGGAAFGILKGALIVSVLFLALTAFLPRGNGLLKNSYLAPYVSQVSETLAHLVSKEMRQRFDTKLEELRRAWNLPG